MSRVTEYGIIPVFQGQDGQLTVQPRMLFESEEDAKRAAEIFAEVLGGAVAFSKVVDSETGFAEDGIIIGKYGVLAAGPEEEIGSQPRGSWRDRFDGRPRLSLRKNPERYILTFFEAQLRLCALARLARREAGTGFAPRWDAAGAVGLDAFAEHDDDDTPRQIPSIPTAMEFLAREARSLHQVDEACPDARWFIKMTGAWAFTLAGTNAEAAWNGALACAIEADEQAFFDRVLAPWITHRFRHGRTTLPRVDDPMSETEKSFEVARVGAIRRLEHDPQGEHLLSR